MKEEDWDLTKKKKEDWEKKKRGNKRGTQEKELGDVGTRHFLLLHDIVGETKKLSHDLLSAKL